LATLLDKAQARIAKLRTIEAAKIDEAEAEPLADLIDPPKVKPILPIRDKRYIEGVGPSVKCSNAFRLPLH
jgi:hypothetical protein